jgi:hypothetical protein
MRIRLALDGKRVEATLLDIATASAPAGVDPSVGDIAYYAP